MSAKDGVPVRPKPGSLLRLAGPHRAVCMTAFGAVVGVHAADAPGAAVLFPLLALVVIALGATRLWSPLRPILSPARQSLVMGVAGAGASGAFVLSVMTGNLPCAALLLVLFAVEWLNTLPPLTAARRVPLEAGLVVSEGVLLPALGYAAVAPWPVPWPALALAALVSAAMVTAGFLQEPAADGLGFRVLRSIVAPIVPAITAPIALGGAIALVLAGKSPALDPELALLSVPVAAMATFFALLALADPRPEWRARRVEWLVTSGGVALCLGLAVVLLIA